MDFVPFRKLSPEKLQENLAILEVGNKVLKKWAMQLIGKRKLRIFRERLFKGEFRDKIPEEDYRKIMSVDDIKVEMLHAFAPLITIRAKIWASRMDGDHTVLEDVYQEANFAFEDAVFGYLGVARKAKFITYVWRVIDRRLRREIESKKFQLVPPSADGAREIVRKYEQFQQTCGRHVTFDEYVTEMKLDQETVAILQKALACVIPESEFKRGAASINLHSPSWISEAADYTAYRAYPEEDIVEQDVYARELRRNLEKCIAIARLTDFQKDLLYAACHQSNQGWKAEIARKYGLTRTRAGQAFKEAVQKVREVYEQLREQGEL